jgi:putative ABC transport system permease protein
MKKLNTKLRRDLLANKWLFLAVTIVIVFGVALFGSSSLAFENLKSSYDHTYEKLQFADFTIDVTSAPAEAADTLRQVPGVAAVAGRLNTNLGLTISGENGRSVVVTAISVSSGSHPAVNDLKIESGSYFTPGEKRGVLVEKSFANYHHIKPGDGVTISGNETKYNFTVNGIVTSPEYIFPAKSRSEFFISPDTWGVIFIPEDALPDLVGNGNINEFCILAAKEANIDKVMNQCQAQLAQYNIVDVVPKAEQPSNAGLKLDLQEFGEIADVFPLLFLFVAAMTTYILITRIIQRQRGEIGLIRALGYTRGQVLRHYLSFSLILGISGAVIGIIVGYFLAEIITHFYVGMLGLPYTVVEVHWMVMEEGLFIGILPSLIAGIFPALAAARLHPAEAMRTPPPTTGRKPWLEKAFPFLKNLPLLWKMPLRNIFRNRRRSVSTVLGVIFGTVLIMSALGFVDSLNSLMHLQFDQIQRYDARLSFAQPMPQTEMDKVSAWSEVAIAEPTLSLPVTLGYNNSSFTTLVKGLTPDEQLYVLYATSGQETTVVPGEILLADSVRKKLDVKTGDTITVSYPPGQIEFKVAGFVQQPMGAYGFVTLHDAQRLVGGQAIITGILTKTSPNDIASLRQRASQSFNAVSVEVSRETRDRMMALMNLVYVIMGVMLAFGAILSLMVVFTMITISLVERRREIATMRTLGEKSSRISGMVTIENIILGIVGLIFGIPLGYGVILYLMGLFQTDMFSFKTTIFAQTYLLTAGIILVIMLLSQIPGIHNLSHLDLARVTKEQVS